jgi:hypothetical protein
MRSLVEDTTVGANFSVLMLLKLDSRGKLEATATVFTPYASEFEADLELE